MSENIRIYSALFSCSQQGIKKDQAALPGGMKRKLYVYSFFDHFYMKRYDSHFYFDISVT